MRSVFVTCSLLCYLCCSSAMNVETGCEAEFEGRCRCGKVRLNGVDRYVTNCTNSGFTDVSVLKQLPIETEILIFTGNDIGTIPPNVFGDDGKYDRLVKIDFSRNNITEIQGQAFHRVPKVGVLVLNDNRWNVDGEHTRIFANMPLLEELHLDRGLESDPSEGGIQRLVELFRGSPVRHLTTVFLRGNQLGPFFKMDVFCDIPSLSEIYLSDNGIFQVFWNRSCLRSLHTLDLAQNLIEFLPNSTMENLDAIGDVTVDLSDNNFDCDCKMIPFYVWLHETDVHVINKEGYTCKDGFPESNGGALILTLKTNDLQCEIPYVLLGPHFGFVHVALILIVVLISSTLMIVVVAHRHAIVGAFRNVGRPVYRRMQYATIRKEAERELEI